MNDIMTVANPRARYREIFDLLTDYHWIHDLHLTKFFENQAWKNIPVEWDRAFTQLTVDELNNLPFVEAGDDNFTPESSFSCSHLPPDFCQFLQQCQSLSLAREQVTGALEATDVHRDLSRGMSPKKLHEVKWMASLVHRVAVQADCNVVVDIGSGLGYLGQVLHTKYGHTVLGLEGSTGHTERAEKRAAKHGLQCSGLRSVPFEIKDDEENISKFCDLIQEEVSSMKPCQHSHPTVYTPNDHTVKDLGRDCAVGDDCGNSKERECLSSTDVHCVGKSSGTVPVIRTGECFACSQNVTCPQSRCKELDVKAVSPDVSRRNEGGCACNQVVAVKSEHEKSCVREESTEFSGQTDFMVESTGAAKLPDSLGQRQQLRHCGCGRRSPETSLEWTLTDRAERNSRQSACMFHADLDTSDSPCHKNADSRACRAGTQQIETEKEEKMSAPQNNVGDIESPHASHDTERESSVRDDNSTQQTAACNRAASDREHVAPCLTPNTTDTSSDHLNLRVCLIGLHCCGDLTPSLLRLFQRVEFIQAVCCVSCCYHKMQPVPGTDQFHNFPMSKTVEEAYRTVPVEPQKTQERASPSPSLITPCSLRLAAQETRARWAAQSEADHDTHMRRVAFRALLEIFPGSTDGASQDRRNIRKLDYSSVDQFIDSYISLPDIPEDKKQTTRAQLQELYTQVQPLFHHIEPFTCLQVVLQPVLESLVLLDRQCWLQEHGFHGNIIPIFDEAVSPRNFALVSVKNKS